MTVVVCVCRSVHVSLSPWSTQLPVLIVGTASATLQLIHPPSAAVAAVAVAEAAAAVDAKAAKATAETEAAASESHC